MRKNSRKKRIEEILNISFAPSFLQVIDNSKDHEGHVGVKGNHGETHFYIKMNSDLFKHLNKVQMHQKVYTVLKEEFDAGLHAVQLDLN